MWTCMHDVNLQLIYIFYRCKYQQTWCLPSCDDGGEYDSLKFDEYVGEYGLEEDGYPE